MGRPAHASGRETDDRLPMDDAGVLHLIEDDLSGVWVGDLACEGICAVEQYLAKHLAFLVYLDEASA
jgi:hypothetical protein